MVIGIIFVLVVLFIPVFRALLFALIGFGIKVSLLFLFVLIIFAVAGRL